MIGLAPTPLNQVPSLQAFPENAADVETGITTTAELHTGALHESHSLVTYSSQGQTRGLTLHYDSLRAETRLVQYVAIANPKDVDASKNEKLALTLTARNGNAVYEAKSLPDSETREQLDEAGMSENTFFAEIPTGIQDTQQYGIGIPLDLSEAATGLYTLSNGLSNRPAAGVPAQCRTTANPNRTTGRRQYSQGSVRRRLGPRGLL